MGPNTKEKIQDLLGQIKEDLVSAGVAPDDKSLRLAFDSQDRLVIELVPPAEYDACGRCKEHAAYEWDGETWRSECCGALPFPVDIEADDL